jgi:putative transposase
VPKLNAIKAKVHRPVDGKLKSITLSRTVTGKYYASLLYETQQPAPVPLMNVDAVNVLQCKYTKA